MEYIIVGTFLYLLYLAGNWIKKKVMDNPIVGEVMDEMGDLGEW